MAIQIEAATNGLINLKISHLMTAEDMKQCQEAVLTASKLSNKLKGLIVLEEFQGWEKSKAWEDISFFVENEKKIEKIAVVGDLKWRDDIFAFLGGPFRSASIEFFNPSQESEARSWLE